VFWKTLAAGALCALVLVAAASAAAHARARTVSLKITISGAGMVQLGNKPAIKCTSNCHGSFQVEKGSRVTLVARPGKLGKLGPWKGACKGSASRCTLRATRKEHVTATFVPPGTRTNPIPMRTSWPIGNGWTLRVVGATPNADGQVIESVSGLPAVPRFGTQFFMLDIVLSYPAAGSAMLGPMAQNWAAEGSHNFKYEYFADTRCGVPANVSLPAPDLQPMILNNESVSSGQSVEGHICFQIAMNDASTLRLTTAPHRHGGAFDVWFALRS
jgi:hypothetical protein